MSANEIKCGDCVHLNWVECEKSWACDLRHSQHQCTRAHDYYEARIGIKAPVEKKDQAPKDDDGKLPLNLIPPEAIKLLGQVYAYGAKKYGRDSWRKGFEPGRLIAAARRHDLAYTQGEHIDPESGLPHAAHAAFNYLTLEILRQTGKLYEHKD